MTDLPTDLNTNWFEGTLLSSSAQPRAELCSILEKELMFKPMMTPPAHAVPICDVPLVPSPLEGQLLIKFPNPSVTRGTQHRYHWLENRPHSLEAH